MGLSWSVLVCPVLSWSGLVWSEAFSIASSLCAIRRARGL